MSIITLESSKVKSLSAKFNYNEHNELGYCIIIETFFNNIFERYFESLDNFQEYHDYLTKAFNEQKILILDSFSALREMADAF